MNNTGQIVEIPITSPLYKREEPDFLSKREELLWKSDESIYSLFDGFLVGGHSGVEHFRLGQRKGIKVGGKKQPLYVIQIDQHNNRLFVGAGENHPGLWTNVLSFESDDVEWTKERTFTTEELENGIPLELLSSVVDEKVSALLYQFDNSVYLEFEKPSSRIIKENPIQFFYQNILIANIT